MKTNTGAMLKFLKSINLDKIDSYTFIKQMTGGQASTTLVYEDEENNPIVLKLLIAPRNDTELDTFKHEANALIRFAEYEGMSFCPKIIGELEQLPGYPIYYYKMEYIYGFTLKKYIEDSQDPLSWELALSLIQRISMALGAGTMWYVHRDLHLGNIMINGTFDFDKYLCGYNDPGVRILDYGCCKDSFQARFGEWKGDKFRHVGGISTWSPEFIYNPESVESTHDSWAIGLILYYLITKKHLFRASCFGELIEQYKSTVDLEDIKNVPYAVLCLLKNLLSIEPKTRFRTGEIADMCSDMLYKNLGKFDNLFVDNYFNLRGRLCHCANCMKILGGVDSICPDCGRIADEDNTIPVLSTKDKKDWPKLPI